MIAFFRKLAAGHVRRHRLEAVLCLVGVALGVAVVVAIDGAVAACVRSFGGAVESLAERSTHGIFANDGPLTDQQYVDLVRLKLPHPLAPVIDREVLAATPTHDAGLARLIGVDVFAERRLRSFTKVGSSLDDAAFRQFLTEPGTVVLVDALAKRLSAKAGDVVTLTAGARRVRATVAGVVEVTGVARSQLTDVIIADLATAQELTDSVGHIDRVDTALPDDAAVAALAARLPDGLALRSTRQRAQSLDQLVASYRMNLNALSLMASFVAVFIVYNSMLISVRQRATGLGILRCLGASRWQLGGIYAAEAAGYAIVGGTIGVLGGWALAGALVGYVSTTINDLYAAVRPGPVALDGATWAKGLGVAVVSCAVGALVPLWQASRTPPVTAWRGTERQRASGAAAWWLLLIGALLVALSYGLYLLPGESPVAGFGMAFCVATGFALCCPAVTRAGAAGVRNVARALQLLPVQMAAGGVGRSLGITGVAVAATMLAMAMNVGVRTMVTSFRTALSSWMDQRFAADVFVAPELLVNHRVDATLDPAVVAWVRARAETLRAVPYRTRDVPVDGKPAMLVATDVAALLATLPIKSRVNGADAFDPRADALVSEPLAGRAKLSAGDAVTIDTPSGPRSFRAYGVYFDFGTERGQLMIDHATYASLWDDAALNALHVTLRPGHDRAAVAAAWSGELRQAYPVAVDAFDFVKGEAMRIFDRTFKVTEVLTWLSGGVAFCGLAGSLLALALARRRDYAILAGVGMSGRQTAAWVLAQGLILAWASTLVAPVAGTLLAYVLAYVIQYRSFGWSIPTTPQPAFWLQTWALATLAACVAAVYPVLRLRRTPPAEHLRPE